MESTTTPQSPTRLQVAISLGVFILVMSAAFGVAQIQPWVNKTLQHDHSPQDDDQKPLKKPEFDELQGDAKAVNGAVEDFYYQ